MRRYTITALLAVAVLTLGAGSAFAGEGAPPGDGPAVTQAEPPALDEDEAWTFRYLVPTLLAMGVLAVVVTALAYGRRVKGRYRLAR
ncbi:MAG TPA: hypothetical protein VMM81_00920 [Acidimicrobiia bacterium]|nr:hypothetical protein [Acidimicrobiia bacterium]